MRCELKMLAAAVAVCLLAFAGGFTAGMVAHAMDAAAETVEGDAALYIVSGVDAEFGEVYECIDRATGAAYLVIVGEDGSVAVTPRYDSAGVVMLTGAVE